MALKFHPDKNPESSERFTQVNHAYLFLTSSSIRNQNSQEVNVKRILICLRAQTIVYSRYITGNLFLKKTYI